MAPSSIRALHYVIKVADRTATVGFLHDVSLAPPPLLMMGGGLGCRIGSHAGSAGAAVGCMKPGGLGVLQAVQLHALQAKQGTHQLTMPA